MIKTINCNPLALRLLRHTTTRNSKIEIFLNSKVKFYRIFLTYNKFYTFNNYGRAQNHVNLFWQYKNPVFQNEIFQKITSNPMFVNFQIWSAWAVRKKPRLLTLPQPVILAVRMSMMMIHSLALNMNVIGMVSHKMSKI